MTVPLARPLLAAGATIAALGLAEAVLRVIPAARAYYVLPPGTEWTIQPAPDLLPGVTGVSRFTINTDGIRGRPFGPDSAEYRLLAVGGSATESALLDDREAWPRLLEEGLPRTSDGHAPWVGNVGRSGLTTRDHVLQLKYLLRQYPRIDAVVALVGVNDLQAALAQGWDYRPPPPVTEPAGEGAQLSHAFAVLPRVSDPAVPWYKRTALWQLARRARRGIQARRDFDLAVVAPKGLERRRAWRRQASRLVDSLPPLARPLAAYRENLDAMAHLAAAAGTRLIFVTQPALWGDTLPDAQARLLWFGWLGPERRSTSYYTAAALARAMTAYNAELLDVCRTRGVECVDAARVLSGDPAVFMDDVHLTEAGSARLAGVLAGYLGARPPFTARSPGVARRPGISYYSSFTPASIP